MNVLVTGALGHIGSLLIRRLADEEDCERVRVLDNLSTNRYCSLFDLPKGTGYELMIGDICNEVDAARACVGMDVVVHLAAVTNAGETIKKPEETHRVNYFGTETMLRAAISSGVRRFIFISTTSVYGPLEGTAYENLPDERLLPQSPYALSKLDAEKALLYAHNNDLIDLTILRFGTVFGFSPGMRFHTAVNQFVFHACMGFPIQVWDGAMHQSRPYLDIADAVESIVFTIGSTARQYTTYNVATLNASVETVLATIQKFVSTIEIEIVKAPILNQTSFSVSLERLNSTGFRCGGDLNDGISNLVDKLGVFCSRCSGALGQECEPGDVLRQESGRSL